MHLDHSTIYSPIAGNSKQGELHSTPKQKLYSGNFFHILCLQLINYKKLILFR